MAIEWSQIRLLFIEVRSSVHSSYASLCRNEITHFYKIDHIFCFEGHGLERNKNYDINKIILWVLHGGKKWLERKHEENGQNQSGRETGGEKERGEGRRREGRRRDGREITRTIKSIFTRLLPPSLPRLRPRPLHLLRLPLRPPLHPHLPNPEKNRG